MKNQEVSKEELKAKQEALRQRIAKIRKDYERGLDPDPDEQSIQLENAEVLEGLLKSAMEEIKGVEKQLQALEGHSS